MLTRISRVERRHKFEGRYALACCLAVSPATGVSGHGATITFLLGGFVVCSLLFLESPAGVRARARRVREHGAIPAGIQRITRLGALLGFINSLPVAAHKHRARQRRA